MVRLYVDVDTQFDFCDPAGALFVRGAPAAMTRCEALVARAVADGAMIVGSVDSHAHDAWEFAANDRKGPKGEDPKFPAHCVKGTHGWLKLAATLPPKFWFVPNVPDPDAVKRIPAGTQAVYFEKEVYSLFANPNAPEVLDALCPAGPIEFVVFGVATDYCVRAAALGLTEWIAARPARKGSTVAVVVDAIAAVVPETTPAVLDELRSHGVGTVTSDML